MNAQEKIDTYITGLNDWRGERIKEIRRLIREAVPGVQEEWKWNAPCWSVQGLLCSISAFKTHVRLTFFQGAMIADPDHLFLRETDAKKLRAIRLHQDDALPGKALKGLLERAVAYNLEDDK